MIRTVLLNALLALGLSVGAGVAQGFSALALLNAAESGLSDAGGGVTLDLAISQPVPWRVREIADPPRLVMDFRTLDFGRLPPMGLGESAHVTGLRYGPFQGEWSRLVLDLAGPMLVAEAGMKTDAQGARISVRLDPASAEDFLARTAASRAAISDAPVPQAIAPPRRAERGDPRPLVMLDPGHGGVDPGAVRDGVHEADLTLAFARTLRDLMRRDGRFRVEMTRDADEFVSLEGRIALAQRAGADVFISIHADAVAEGIARGAQVWTLSEDASSRAGAQLAERHNRADLLAGLDLSDQDDRIARVLMDIARTETEPRTEALADALVAGLKGGGIRMHSRPRESAGFAVLKAPDIPSVLVEIGFMSSPGELEKLTSPEWRAGAAQAVAQGLWDWAEADAARAALNRR